MLGPLAAAARIFASCARLVSTAYSIQLVADHACQDGEAVQVLPFAKHALLVQPSTAVMHLAQCAQQGSLVTRRPPVVWLAPLVSTATSVQRLA